MSIIDTQINETDVKSTKNLVSEEKQRLRLLNHLKGISLEQRIVEFKSLRSKRKLTDFEFNSTELKRILSSFPTVCRFNILQDLVEQWTSSKPKLKKFKIDPNQLKAILMLFSEENRYMVLQYLKEHFDFQITASQLEGLRGCLLKDPIFYKLLPFKQKQFLDSLLIQPNDNKHCKSTIINAKNQNFKLYRKKSNSKSLIQKSTDKSLSKSEIDVSTSENDFETFLKKFSLASEKEQFNLIVKLQQEKPKLLTKYLKTSENITDLVRWIPEKTAQKYLALMSITSAIMKATFSWSAIENLVEADQQTIYQFMQHLVKENKLAPVITNIKQLKLLLKMLAPETRFEFLMHPKMNPIFKNKTINMQVTDLKDFIEIFPQNDAFNFMKSSWIKNRINSFWASNRQLTNHDYTELLNYFPSMQKQEVQKVLKPISPIINTKLFKLGTIKENKREYTYSQLPDVIPNANTFRTR